MDCIRRYESIVLVKYTRVNLLRKLKTKRKKINFYSFFSLLSKPTTLKICGIHCVIGYESGELCLFEMLDENVYVRIVGHRLKVTAIDITPIRHMILTVSADAYLKIWQYKHNVSQVITNEPFNQISNFNTH